MVRLSGGPPAGRRQGRAAAGGQQPWQRSRGARGGGPEQGGTEKRNEFAAPQRSRGGSETWARGEEGTRGEEQGNEAGAAACERCVCVCLVRCTRRDGAEEEKRVVASGLAASVEWRGRTRAGRAAVPLRPSRSGSPDAARPYMQQKTKKAQNGYWNTGDRRDTQHKRNRKEELKGLGGWGGGWGRSRPLTALGLAAP